MSTTTVAACECVSQLASCPPELLALIAGNLAACDVTRLFACGFLVLNRKLLHGGVLELNVDFSLETSPVWRFNLLRRFQRLRTFRLTSPQRLVPGFEWFALELLPRELTTLELNYAGAVKLWIRSLSNGVGDPRIIIHTVNGKFPFLKNLTLRGRETGWGNETDSNPEPTASSSAVNWTSDLRESFLKGLPLSLRTLELAGFGVWRENDFKYFPRKLTSLTLHSEAYTMESIPRTLETLCLSYDSVVMAKHMLQSLPPCITRFSAPRASFSLSLLEALPSHLLHLRIPGSLHTFSLAELSNCFRQLLTLDLPDYDQSISSDTPAFPPSLIELSLGDWEMTKVFLDTLPRTLRQLEVGTKGDVQEFFGLFVPPKLQTLRMRNNTNLTEDCLSYLPKHVLYIQTATAKFRGLAPPKSPADSSSEEGSDTE